MTPSIARRRPVRRRRARHAAIVAAAGALTISMVACGSDTPDDSAVSAAANRPAATTAHRGSTSAPGTSAGASTNTASTGSTAEMATTTAADSATAPGTARGDQEPSESATSSASPTCRTQPDGRSPVGTVAVRGEVVASGLETPWGIGWLPDRSMLVTERNGSVRYITADGTLRADPVVRVPATESSEGGLLGIAIHPDFESNRSFYVYYSTDSSGGKENVVERYTLADDATTATSAGTIADGIPAARFHSGGRLAFGPDAKLYIGTGDATRPELSQDLTSLAGKLLRVDDDGSVPADNPDTTSPVWLSGIRNTQGFDWRADGTLVVTDHGPSGAPEEDGRTGHDEVTVARRGDDLGWPDVIGCDTKDDATTPSLAWTAAVPPGGAAIYTGTEIPDWTGDLFIGVLGLEPGVGHLHRVRLDDDGNATLDEAYLLDAGYGRIRDVTMGPDGGLYFTTSNCDGRGDCGDGDRIIRVRPGSDDSTDVTTTGDDS